MEQRVIIPRVVVVRNIMTVYGITTNDIKMNAFVSDSMVSRYLSGEKESYDISKYLIGRVFEIRVKEYDVERKYS